VGRAKLLTVLNRCANYVYLVYFIQNLLIIKKHKNYHVYKMFLYCNIVFMGEFIWIKFELNLNYKLELNRVKVEFLQQIFFSVWTLNSCWRHFKQSVQRDLSTWIYHHTRICLLSALGVDSWLTMNYYY